VKAKKGLKNLYKGVFIMGQRINAIEKAGGALKALYGITAYLAKSPLEKNLQELVEYRVSQINGCAYCLDMHSKDLRHGGETEQRIYTVAAWRETPFFTDRERAALAFAEELTVLGRDGVSDEVYEQAASQFNEQELIDLTLAVATINAYNRLNIAFRTEAGGYQPGQWSATAA
jgi:AhpD family alkylhydroperoxidase